jgi:hypothetical protein
MKDASTEAAFATEKRCNRRQTQNCARIPTSLAQREGHCDGVTVEESAAAVMAAGASIGGGKEEGDGIIIQLCFCCIRSTGSSGKRCAVQSAAAAAVNHESQVQDI